MTDIPNDEPAKIEAENSDEWEDFQFILTDMLGKIGVIRYLENVGDVESGTVIGEFFALTKIINEMAEDLYASYMSGISCVYCDCELQADWDDEEHHDDIVFFQVNGNTETAHRFCRSEAMRGKSSKDSTSQNHE